MGTDELLTFVLPAHGLQRLHARIRGGENERLREEVREEGRGGKKREKYKKGRKNKEEGGMLKLETREALE